MKKIIICAICAICGFTTANAQAKFGHVNTQEIIQAMPEYNKAKTEIDALQAQYEADLKSMQDELQKKGEAFDKEQANLPENIKQRRQTELCLDLCCNVGRECRADVELRTEFHDVDIASVLADGVDSFHHL